MKTARAAFALPYILPVALALAGFGLLAWFLSRQGAAAAAAASDVKTETSGLSFPLSAYSGFADQIEAAGRATLGTDEDTIFGVFRKLKTRRDVLQLIVAFGERRLDFALASSGLAGYLANELDSDDIAEINLILSEKGIDYAF